MSQTRCSLAGTIAVLARRLPPEHVAAWARVLRESDIAGPDLQARLIEAKSGFAIGGMAALLVDAWRAAGSQLTGPAIALALESAAMTHEESVAHRSEVVVSGPVSDSTPVRLTSSMISEVIHESRESLLVVSFAAFGVAEVVYELERAAQRGVRIDLVLESTTAEGGTLHGPVGPSAAFETLRRHVTFWTWPAVRRPVVGASRAALHAKLVAADERVAFLGSANLTDKALAYNLELGVIIRDLAVVRSMVRHFRSLMRSGDGPLEIVADLV
jgi:phosphatidylserine/phosphatidylglycerophosphate/cardiolipin synthase-like enzyme